jgi:hypothetical protein
VSGYFFLTENPRKYKQVKLIELELHAIPDFRRKLHNNSHDSPNSLVMEEFTDDDDLTFKLFRKTSDLGSDIFVSSTNPQLLQTKEKSIFLDRSVIMTCILYALLGYLYTILDNVFPLWSMQEISAGGLGFSTRSLGIANSMAGGMTVLIQLFIYHRVADKLGLIRSINILDIC